MNWNDYKSMIVESLDKLEISEEVLQLIKNAKDQGKKIFIAGNGGSAATAAHYSCDLSLGASKGPDCSKEYYLNNDSRYQVVPLTTNMPLILALANDHGYDQIFKQQLINLAKSDDILIAISGSGNSPNIIEAVKYANENNITTIGISGFDGGLLKKLAKYNIHVDLDHMEACEDIHSIIGHYISVWLRSN